jgi:hypothetical protein
MKSVKKKVRTAKARNAVAKTERTHAVAVIRPLSASSLKDVLWETLNDIKNEQMLPSRGDAVAGQAREILRTVKTQIQISAQSKRPIPVEVIDFAEKR